MREMTTRNQERTDNDASAPQTAIRTTHTHTHTQTNKKKTKMLLRYAHNESDSVHMNKMRINTIYHFSCRSLLSKRQVFISFSLSLSLYLLSIAPICICFLVHVENFYLFSLYLFLLFNSCCKQTILFSHSSLTFWRRTTNGHRAR